MRRFASIAAASAAPLLLLALAPPANGQPPAGSSGAGTSSSAGGSTATSIAVGQPASPSTPTLAGLPTTPADYAIDAAAALEAADSDPKIRARKEELGSRQRELTATVTAEAVRVWEVGYFLDGEKVNLVVVEGGSGEVTESWTGSAVDWPMARGHEDQFGHLLNAPWVWGPLAGIFLLGLFDFRRWRKWVHLDLAVLLSFGISEAFFNAAEIGVSVPLYYPPLLYLLIRMLVIGFRGPGRREGAGEGLRPSSPRWLTAALLVGLIALRLAGNIADSGVIDVGYAGVIGADKITDARPIYGADSFPDNNRTGDTYGPANYFAYVPFEQLLPWSGAWDELPAAHAAAIFFDLATIVGLFALGRAMTRRGRDEDEDEDSDGWDTSAAAADRAANDPHRDDPEPTRRARLATWLPHRPGNELGLLLAFAWVAYPYSAYALQSNSNDALLSALLVWSLVLFATPLARGALLATASLAKFAPLVLFPLYAAGTEGIRLRTPEARHALLRPLALFLAAFMVASILLIAHPAVDPGLAAFYDRTIKSQLDRVSPFSIWGQTDLEWLHTAVKVLAIGLAIGVAFVPRRRSLPQIAALGAAVVIAIQLTLEHWFYLYIPWFLPMLLLAIASSSAARSPAPADDQWRLAAATSSRTPLVK